MLDFGAFQEIRKWMYRNARNLELSIWQNLFENGKPESVLSALSFYQNDDGGFGNALEADSWNPNSNPYTTLHAISMLNMIGFDDDEHPVMRGIRKYLKSGAHYSENKWLFSIPTNDDYAHAPWWTYSPEANETESIGLTAELAGFVVTHFEAKDDLYQRALSSIDAVIEMLKTRDRFGEMGIGGYCVLLESLQKAGVQPALETEFLSATVKRLASGSIERDTSKWAFYGVRPSNYIDSPDSIFYKDNEDIVQKELDYLIETRPGGDVWGITWSWFENNERYAKEFAISENWWKAYKAIEKLIFLRNFGRLEYPGHSI